MTQCELLVLVALMTDDGQSSLIVGVSAIFPRSFSHFSSVRPC